MAKKTYSLYETKAKLSQIIREVRTTGQSATVTYRGKPVAEIRAFEQTHDDAFEERLQQLESRGALVRASRKSKGLPMLARKPGALKRFLKDRE
jgi:prevent-host-death family protein